MRCLRLSKRSRRRRIWRAARRVTASEVPSLGFRPSGKIRTPMRMTAQGACSALSRISAQPMDVVPRSSARRYRMVGSMPHSLITVDDLVTTAYNESSSIIGICDLSANKLKAFSPDAPNDRAAICGPISFVRCFGVPHQPWAWGWVRAPRCCREAQAWTAHAFACECVLQPLAGRGCVSAVVSGHAGREASSTAAVQGEHRRGALPLAGPAP